jgi:hypothetical protein
MSENSVLKDIIKEGYETIFVKAWPMWLGGILVGITSIITFAWDRPWGVVGGLRNWADWLFYGVGLYDVRPFSAFTSTNSILVFGLFWGALGAALMAKQFSFRVPPGMELLKGMAGGILLGVGSAFAGGCNVGGFYTSISAMSASGFAMMAGLLIGAYVGLKYLYWEMEHFPGGGAAPKESKAGGFDWNKVKPWLGAAVLLSSFAFSELYSSQGYIIVGGLLLCGVAFGFILHRSRICFARAFREPFMTGEADVTKAVIISLLISMVGFATLKWVGLRTEGVYVTSTFGLGGLVGGAIFGFGMILAGGCGSGTVWRVAEGQVKLMVALFFFATFNSLTRAWTDTSETMQSLLGANVFLPDYLGYQGTIILVGAVMLAWYVAVVWNEETDKFVVEM